MCIILQCDVCDIKFETSHSNKEVKLVDKKISHTADGLYISYELVTNCPQCKQPIHWFDTN